jgi:flagellar assembly protein FliH
MSDLHIDMSGARALSLAELFALERQSFVPTLGAGMNGFTARLPVTSLDAETKAAEPEIDPAILRERELAAARAESFQAGLEAGRAENLEVVEQIVAECRALMQSLDDARTIDKAALGPMLKNQVLDLVTQIVEAHVAADPAFINACVARALSTIKEAHEAARLYLHPDDIATVGDDSTHEFHNLTIAADPELPRGSVRLEAGGGEVEDGVRPRLIRLEQALRAAGIAA